MTTFSLILAHCTAADRAAAAALPMRTFAPGTEPLPVADEFDRAADAEREAFRALLAHRAVAPAEVAAKARHVLNRLRAGRELAADEAEALLLSMA